jgi:hypothetical protein
VTARPTLHHPSATVRHKWEEAGHDDAIKMEQNAGNHCALPHRLCFPDADKVRKQQKCANVSALLCKVRKRLRTFPVKVRKHLRTFLRKHKEFARAQ